jgi:hypothetical protein
MTNRLHAVADADGRPLRVFMTAGQVRDDTGPAALPGSLAQSIWPLANHGHDAGRFRDALKDKGVKPCTPGRKSLGRPCEA